MTVEEFNQVAADWTTLVDHPGVTAALGWSLSERAVDDLVGQLDLTENRQALDGLRDLLDPSRADTLRCA